METIEGVLEDITFYNEITGFTVGVLTDGTDRETIVGRIPGAMVGDSLKVYGHFSDHPDYGPQFAVESYEISAPQSEGAILLFLASGVVRGVGEGTARKIVKHFGEDTLLVLEKEYMRLTELPGIGKARAEEIHDSYLQNMAFRSLLTFFLAFGVSTETAMKIYRTLGSGCVELVKKDPYILYTHVGGFSYQTADKIASALGFPTNFPGRISAGILYTLLAAAMRDGHTCLPKSRLLYEVTAMLRVSEPEVTNELTTLVMTGRVFQVNYDQETFCYLNTYYEAENNVAVRLCRLATEEDTEPMDEDGRIDAISERLSITLSDEQKDAVCGALRHHLMVITGGPGTGKTTIIQVILSLFDEMDKTVLLAAPTGRAAKKMNEVTGHEAKTIHRLLELSFSDSEDRQIFQRNEDFPLEGDVLIVDEMSMVDISLMSHLLYAVPAGMRVILVGDADQLPSIGPGTVLNDVLGTKIPSVRLQTIFRQAAQSMIVQNAHKINKGEMPLLNQKEKDFFFLPRTPASLVSSTLIELVAARLPKAYGFKPDTDIQVLSPVKKGHLGVQSLCSALQARLNPSHPSKKEVKRNGILFREGDKVMQIKNDYELTWTKPNGEEGIGVFNGDIGRLIKIGASDHTFKVRFDDDREVIYPVAKTELLTLAYAITVHKSQGCEFDCLVMPLFSSVSKLLTRNLLYTAITRAKKLVVLVGDGDVLAYMVNNHYQATRFGNLKDKLSASLELHGAE